jgi:hypothetical protein
VTIRKLITRRRRNFLILAFAAWLGFGGSMFVASTQGTPPWFTLIFFAAFGAAILGILFRLRCPRCKGSFGMINAPFNGKTTGINRRIDFCPYCGVSLDEPLSMIRET